jgi:hypothetical protein
MPRLVNDDAIPLCSRATQLVYADMEENSGASDKQSSCSSCIAL